MVPFDMTWPHSYLLSVKIFHLSRAVSKLFSLYAFRWPLTRVSRSSVTPVSTAMLPFESPYPTSYLHSFDISYLTRTVYELFHWPTFGELWPRLSRIPLTPGETWIAPIGRSCRRSYLMSVDIFLSILTRFWVIQLICFWWPLTQRI